MVFHKNFANRTSLAQKQAPELSVLAVLDVLAPTKHILFQEVHETLQKNSMVER